MLNIYNTVHFDWLRHSFFAFGRFQVQILARTFRGFPRAFHENVGIVSQIRSQPYPSTSLLFQFSWISLAFRAIYEVDYITGSDIK